MPQAWQDFIVLLVLLVLAGGLGGAVRAIRQPKDNEIQLSRRRVCLGIWGDVAVGGVTAAAFMFVAKAAFELELDGVSNPSSIDNIVRIVAISITAGYAGAGLLNNLAKQVTDVADEVRAVSSEVRDVRVEAGRADEIERLVRDADDALRAGRYESALRYLEQAMAIDGESAWVISRHAVATSYLHESDLQRLVEAEQALGRAVSLDPSYEYAAYNRAAVRALCIKVARGSGLPEPFTPEQAAESLRYSVSLDRAGLKAAESDADFDAVRDEPGFRRLYGE